MVQKAVVDLDDLRRRIIKALLETDSYSESIRYRLDRCFEEIDKAVIEVTEEE